jgi:signal transduction histidine kinase
VRAENQVKPMESPGFPPIELWLRAVRVGLATTFVVLASMTALLVLPVEGRITREPFAATLAVAALVAVAVWLAPWQRLLSERGPLLLYIWSIADIALISVAVAITGGARSELYVLYALTTVFFAACYPIRVQVVMLGVTLTGYLAALVAVGWTVAPGTFLFRLGAIGAVFLIASFLSRELIRQVDSHGEARRRAERWAELLSSVAAAARSTTLEPERVLEVALRGMQELGFQTSAICTVDEREQVVTVVCGAGAPHGLTPGTQLALTDANGTPMVGLGTLALFHDYDRRPDADPLLRAAGVTAVAVAPVWVAGWLAAVLVAGTGGRRSISRQEAEAIEVLASQTGIALENLKHVEHLQHLEGDFLAHVSHELRTPLTVIHGIACTLAESWEAVDDGTRAELFRALIGNTTSLQSMLENVLDTVGVENGSSDIAFTAMDLSGLLRRIAARLRLLFGERSLLLEVELGLTASADPMLIERAVENLLSNAAKYSNGSVTLRALSQDGEIVVSVSDEGPGLTSEELEHVGERFWRGRHEGGPARGLGLGLSLIRRILELHETGLEITSTPDAGSVFSFRLRAAVTVDELVRDVS